MTGRPDGTHPTITTSSDERHHNLIVRLGGCVVSFGLERKESVDLYPLGSTLTLIPLSPILTSTSTVTSMSTDEYGE